ncbi:hypothetical protein [Hafnia phage Pocis76]|uniref:Uncharacterized protein n=1 Tax=Hafnia phage Pocis76 TaxID=2831174 RepID=A0A8E7KYW5_9CAUD|nr:hypothetical protein [Hafnia phage Pocis76]
MTRDEERFLSCLKKSKSKIIKQRFTYCLHYYFTDVVQTGWVSQTIDGLIESGVISLEYVDDKLYRVARIAKT